MEQGRMALKEQITVAAEALLMATPTGLTSEALTSLVAKQVKRQLLLAQVTSALRERPQRFVEGEGGRWQLREQQMQLLPDEPASPSLLTTSPASSVQPLKRG